MTVNSQRKPHRYAIGDKSRAERPFMGRSTDHCAFSREAIRSTTCAPPSWTTAIPGNRPGRRGATTDGPPCTHPAMSPGKPPTRLTAIPGPCRAQPGRDATGQAATTGSPGNPLEERADSASPRTLTCPGKSPFTCIQWPAGDSAPPSCPSTHRYSTSENSAESSHGLLAESPRRAKPPHRRSSRLFELGPSVNSAHQAVAVA